MNKLTKIIIGSALATGVLVAVYWSAIEFVLKDYQNMSYIVFKYTYSKSNVIEKPEVTIVKVEHNLKYPSNFVVPEKLLGYPVTAIGEYAFAGLDRLKTVELPKTITRIENGAFSKCINLTKVKNKAHSLNYVGSDVFKDSNKWEGYNQKGLVIVDSILYSYNGDIASGTTVKGIEDKVASDDNNTIYIGEDINGIASGAFADQPGIVSFTLPNRFDQINDQLLKGCTNLVTLDYNNAKRIGDDAFNGCTSLENISLNNDFSYVGARAFKGTKIRSFIMPEQIKIVNEGLFADCAEFTDIKFAENTTSIGAEAFLNCVSLTSIIEYDVDGNHYNNDIDEVSVIGERAFKNTAIKEMVLPKRLRAIQKETFADCSHLTKIVLPDVVPLLNAANEAILDVYNRPDYLGIQAIGGSAFKNAINLEEIFFPYLTLENNVILNTLSSIGENAFENTGIKSIVVPASIDEIPEKFVYDCVKLETVTFQNSSKHVIVGTTEKHETLSEANYKAVKSSAFAKTPLLKSIVFPNKIESIYESALKDSGVETVVLPTNPKFQTLNEYLFENCINLVNVVIPESINTIKEAIFRNCSALREVYLAGKIVTFKENVFSGCSNLLAISIYYQSDEIPLGWDANWNAISLSPSVEKAQVIYGVK